MSLSPHSFSPQSFPPSSFPPRAYLIGAMKAGTTSLANWLNQHPDLALARPKEPAYFTRNWERGLDWYRGCFSAPEAALLLDASTANANAPTERFPAAAAKGRSAFAGVPARILGLRPDAKFIYVLRDPVARCYSAYWHAVREGWEKRSFRQAVEADSDFLRASDYQGQIANYLEHIPVSSFHFILFEEMIRDPEGTSAGCFRFLGLDERSIEVPREMRHSHASFRFNSLGRTLGGGGQAYGAVKTAVKRVAPRLSERLRGLVKTAMTERIPPLSEEDRARVLARLSGAQGDLERLTGLDLGAWRS